MGSSSADRHTGCCSFPLSWRVVTVRALAEATSSAKRATAQLLADGLALSGYSVIDDLGENDRSATGYLAKEEFEETSDAFFAHPQESVRG